MKRIIIILLLLSLSLNMVGCLLPIPQISAPPSPKTETPSNNVPPKPIAPAWSPSPTVSETPPLPSIADVVEKVYPSVVTIATEVTTLDFFNMPQTQSGAGSGWIIDENGIIVTNNHVVEGAKKVTVGLADGRTFQVDPDSIRRDPSTDMAIIKIDAKNLPAASLGDSTKLRVGDWVVAIGNPLGLGLRAKQGIVSGLKVSLSVEQGQPLDDLIETSAAINPGNSGGPLANMSGQVIGITSAKITAFGVEGMGYAISIKTAIPIIEQLIKNGYVIRPYLGVQLYTVDQNVAMINSLPVDKGVVITYVAPGGPADKAGLKAGDIITQFKDKEVTTDYELLQDLHSSQIGEEVKITIIRGKDTKVVYARLIQTPPPSG